MDKIKLSIDTTVPAAVERVWEYWTEPGHITKWNFASDDWHCPKAINDLRKGGKYAARMEAKDGSFGFDLEAVYDEVVKHREIHYTMADGRQVITIFEPDGNYTKIRTTFDAEALNPIEMQQAGWQAILDNFKKYVARASG